MITCALAFLMSLILALKLTPVIRNLAARKGVVDTATSTRKVHRGSVPRIGGLAIVIAFHAPLIALLFIRSEVGKTVFADWRQFEAILIGGLIIALLGIVDDVRGLRARSKLIVQLFVAAGLYLAGFAVQRVTTPWGVVPLGALSFPFTMIWVVGVINAMNLVDGLDGLASGVAFFAVATNFVVAAATGNVLMMLLMACLAGALLGFLVYNFNPASVFMGDTGSMFLGYVLATTSVVTNSKSTATVAMMVPIVALGLPIMDTFLAMWRRAIRGRPLFSADREHVHHKLLELGLSQRSAVFVLYGVCLTFAVLALAIAFASAVETALVLGVCAAVSFVLIRKLGYLSGNVVAMGEERRKNLGTRRTLEEVAIALRRSAEPSAAWDAVRPIAKRLGASSMELTLTGWTGATEECSFVWRARRDGGQGTTLTLPLVEGDTRYGTIAVTWTDGRNGMARDDEICLETLRDHLVSAAKRHTARS